MVYAFSETSLRKRGPFGTAIAIPRRRIVGYGLPYPSLAGARKRVGQALPLPQRVYHPEIPDRQFFVDVLRLSA